MFEAENGEVDDVAVTLKISVSYQNRPCYFCTLRTRELFCSRLGARISKICQWALFYGYITVRLVRSLHVRQSRAFPAVIISVEHNVSQPFSAFLEEQIRCQAICLEIS